MQLVDAGLAANTRRSYGTGIRSFALFIASKLPGTVPLPASIPNACAWIAFLHRGGIKYSTIKVYISGLASAHRDAGLSASWVKAPIFGLIFRGIKRVQGTANTVRKKLPITFEVLRAITPRLDGSDHDGITIRAAIWMATAGLLRTGELTVDSALQPDPLRLLTMSSLKQIQTLPTVLSVHLRASKTDPFRTEVDVPITNTTAVRYLQSYTSYRTTAGTGGPHQPLFLMSNGRPLTRSTLLATVRHLLSAAGIDTSKHSGISFRRGGATALANAQVEDRLIKLAGRWRSTSYSRYIDVSLPTLQQHLMNL